MKKNILKVAFAAAFVAVAGYGVYTNQKTESMSGQMLANVEALATPEQPNVDDCIYDPNYRCEALHPTDSSKDQRRDNARC